MKDQVSCHLTIAVHETVNSDSSLFASFLWGNARLCTGKNLKLCTTESSVCEVLLQINLTNGVIFGALPNTVLYKFMGVEQAFHFLLLFSCLIVYIRTVNVPPSIKITK